MTWRRKLNNILMSWRSAGGLKHGIVDILGRSRRNSMVVVGATIIIIIVALALLAPVLPIADPTPSTIDPEETLLGPSSRHWFGTDELGRDVFSRVIWGARISLLVATLVVFFSLLIGLTLGLTAGYFGGAVDYLIAGTIDLFWTFPAFLLALAFAAALGPSLVNIYNRDIDIVLVGIRSAHARAGADD